MHTTPLRHSRRVQPDGRLSCTSRLCLLQLREGEQRNKRKDTAGHLYEGGEKNKEICASYINSYVYRWRLTPSIAYRGFSGRYSQKLHSGRANISHSFVNIQISNRFRITQCNKPARTFETSPTPLPSLLNLPVGEFVEIRNVGSLW